MCRALVAASKLVEVDGQSDNVCRRGNDLQRGSLGELTAEVSVQPD